MRRLILISCLLVFYEAVFAQYTPDLPVKDRYMRIMFYNVENLFDTENDSLTKDDEFLPNTAKAWTKNRYYDKLNKIAAVIVAVGAWQTPEIIGLCEIENRKVLNDLCKHTGLRNLNYQIIHKESPDRRGIDVAFLYKKEAFKPLMFKAIPVKFQQDTSMRTRDILYVKGIAKNHDSLHVFINHWSSRWGGQMASEYKRIAAAQVLRNCVDSIFKTNKFAKIVIMGDLNDYPDNKSVAEVLDAKNEFSNIKEDCLYNLSAFISQTKNIGSHKHKGKWGVLDQIIVSGALMNAKKGVATSRHDAYIFNAAFLQIQDT